MRTRRDLIVAVVAALAVARGAAAQTPAWRPWRPTIAVGGALAGAESLGTRTIEARAAAVGTRTPAGFVLFRADSSLDRGLGGELVVTLPLTPSIAVDLTGSAGSRTLTTRLTSDAESAAATSATERVSDYTIGGRASWLWPAGPWPRRLRPYAAAGGAYVRQLHEDRVLVETGQAWRADLGAHVWLRGGGPADRLALGLTAEFGWRWRTGGITFVDGARTSPAAGLRVFAGF